MTDRTGRHWPAPPRHRRGSRRARPSRVRRAFTLAFLVALALVLGALVIVTLDHR